MPKADEEPKGDEETDQSVESGLIYVGFSNDLHSEWSWKRLRRAAG